MYICTRNLTLNLTLMLSTIESVQGNGLDKLRHTRAVACLVDLVLLNKHKILGGGAYLHRVSKNRTRLLFLITSPKIEQYH